MAIISTNYDKEEKKVQPQPVSMDYGGENAGQGLAPAAAPAQPEPVPGRMAEPAPASQTPSPASAYVPPAPRTSYSGGYDPNSDKAYRDALAALQNAEKNMPDFTGSYDSQLQDIYDRIVNRDKFSYDINGDMLYQQYKNQYVGQGQMAMRDAMGQAASLTGGYGSSYVQAVGQQQYDAYLQKLNEAVPQLYGMAMDNYDREGRELYDLYGLTGDMADDEYAKYMDSYNRWLSERSYAQQQLDRQYQQGYDQWSSGYGVQQDNYDRLLTLIGGSGYAPSDEELEAAGMSREQANSVLNKYLQDNQPKGRAYTPPKGKTTDPGISQGIIDTISMSLNNAKTPEEVYALYDLLKSNTGVYPPGTLEAMNEEQQKKIENEFNSRLDRLEKKGNGK